MDSLERPGCHHRPADPPVRQPRKRFGASYSSSSSSSRVLVCHASASVTAACQSRFYLPFSIQPAARGAIGLGVSLDHSITPSLHHSITRSLHHSITPPLHHSATPPLRTPGFEDEDDDEDEYEAPIDPPFPNATIPYPRSRIRRAEI
jgi:hypothetical protein